MPSIPGPGATIGGLCPDLSENESMAAAESSSPSPRKVLAIAWPIMCSYVAVGLACGVLSERAGMTGAEAFLLSATYLSGGGQFMIANLWLAGTPMGSLVISVCAISTRFALYSASLAPLLRRYPRRGALAVAATYPEEAYGITLEKLARGDAWSAKEAFGLNIVLMLTWAGSVAAGACLGSAVQVPTALASFAMTALFIYLLMGQLKDAAHGAAAAAAVLAVFLSKCAGAGGAAIPIAAVAGVASALAVAEMRRR